MRPLYRLIAAGLALGIGMLLWLAGPLLAQDQDPQGDAGAGEAVVLEVDGPISPATQDFIVRGIEDAEAGGAALVIIRLNTPGGLDKSMREIIRKILASTVPVATYVSPSGSRAASAGTYMMYASHVAAMAPATNLGSATPVSMSPGGLGGDDQEPRQPAETGAPATEESAGDEEEGAAAEAQNGEAGADSEESAPAQDEAQEEAQSPSQEGSAMKRKVINDAVAYIKGLARLRDRNEEWAEEAVRAAVNLTAEDALEKNVIDVVAGNVQDLLEQIDGRTVTVNDNEMVLATRGLSVRTVEPDWRTELLAIITNPNVAYILMLAGVYGLFFELSNPGALFPGVLGAISLLLALYAFQVLPVNYAGLALILVGIAFMVGELFMPSFGVMGIGGVVAFVIGSTILIDTDVAAYQISLPLIITVTAITGLFVLALVTMAVRQRSRPVATGREEMIGSEGYAAADFQNGSGPVHIHSEQWSARADTEIRSGQRVRVREMNGLILIVEPVEESS